MGGAVAALISQIVIMFILMAIGYFLYRMPALSTARARARWPMWSSMWRIPALR